MTGRYVASIDQGTASSRCFVFDERARIVSVAQQEHRQHFPRPGWVEHDPQEIWRQRPAGRASCAREGRPLARRPMRARDRQPARDRRCCGTAAPVRRCTTRSTGRTREPTVSAGELAREFGQDRFREKTGLPVTTYFSGPKIRWLLDHIPGLRERARGGRGAVRDDGLVADLEPVRPPRHRRDQRQPDVADEHPHARLGSGAARRDRSPGGDAAGDPGLVGGLRRGRVRRSPGSLSPRRSATSTPRWSGRPASTRARRSARSGPEASSSSTPARARWPPTSGLLTTLGYKLGSAAPAYALEGSIAITGALVQWFRDNIGLIGSAPEIETLALTVEDNGGCYFVPAFSGLFAPHWRSDARGVIAGPDRLHQQGPPRAGGARGDRVADARSGRRDERRLRQQSSPNCASTAG